MRQNKYLEPRLSGEALEHNPIRGSIRLCFKQNVSTGTAPNRYGRLVAARFPSPGFDRDASPKAASRFSERAPTVRLAGCPHNLTFCGASGLGGHRVLDQADNGREYDTADTAASQLTDNAVENGIETAAG